MLVQGEFELELVGTAALNTFQKAIRGSLYDPTGCEWRPKNDPFTEELEMLTFERFLESPLAVQYVAREWAGWDPELATVTADVDLAPLIYLPEDQRFLLRWPKSTGHVPRSIVPNAPLHPVLEKAVETEDDQHSMSALTAMSVITTESGSLLRNLAVKLGKGRKSFLSKGVNEWRAAVEAAIKQAALSPASPLEMSNDFAERLIDVVLEHGQWQQMDGWAVPVIPDTNYWWWGTWLLSREAATTPKGQPEQATEFIAYLSIVKRALWRPGRRRVAIPRPTGNPGVPPGAKPVLKALRCKGVETGESLRKLTWLWQEFSRDLVEGLSSSMQESLQMPHIRQRVEADERLRRHLHERYGLSSASIPAQRWDPAVETPVIVDLDAPVSVEAVAPVPARTRRPLVVSTMQELRPSRPAAVMWASAASAWSLRGQRAAEATLWRITGAVPPTHDQALEHLQARNKVALQVSERMPAYLTHAAMFSFACLLMALGSGAASSELASLMTSHLGDGGPGLGRGAALIPGLGVLLANLSWARARGVAAGLTVWGWTLLGASAMPWLLTGHWIAAAALALPAGVLLLCLLRLTRLVSVLIAPGHRVKATPSKFLNVVVEQTEAPFSTSVESLPVAAALAISPEAFARLHPDLMALADLVRRNEYEAYARYARYAPVLAYTRLARQPMAHFFLVHRGDEGVRIRGFKADGAYR